MSKSRKESGRAKKLAFRPALEGQRLEQRMVLSSAHAPYALNQFLLTHPQVGYALKAGRPVQFTNHAPPILYGKSYNKGVIATQTAHGGQSVIVAAPDGSRFRVTLSLADNQYGAGLTAQTGNSGSSAAIPVNGQSATTVTGLPQPKGTIRAYGMPGGKVGLIVDGSTEQMQLTIDPLPFHQRRGYAHSFAYGESGRSHILNIGSLNVTSGRIAQILGFHSADLSGPLVIGGTTTVDRLAFNSLKQGAAISVGGTLNTLDINTSINLTSGPGITIGQDLNLINVGTDMTLANGASLKVGRFLGVTTQPPKGTGTGSNILSLNQSQIGTGTSQVVPSVSGYIQGNLIIGSGSIFSSASGIANSSAVASQTSAVSASPFLVNGQLQLQSASNVAIFQAVFGNAFGQNQFSQQVNFVARNGIVLNGTTIIGPS